MAEVIPIATNPPPVRSLPIPQTGAVRRSVGHWTDTRGRPLRDLRISVTDHCNFRCRYCMPKEKFSNPHAFLAHTELLTFEEILRIARIVVANGVEKLRLTGGEPLLRKGLEELVAELRRLRTPDGRDIDIALTTNASILHKKAQALRDAGLDRADGRESAVQLQMSRRVAGGLPLALCDLTRRKFDYHHVLGGHSLIGNAGGLYNYPHVNVTRLYFGSRRLASSTSCFNFSNIYFLSLLCRSVFRRKSALVVLHEFSESLRALFLGL